MRGPRPRRPEEQPGSALLHGAGLALEAAHASRERARDVAAAQVEEVAWLEERVEEALVALDLDEPAQARLVLERALRREQA